MVGRIILITSFCIALFLLRSKRFTVYYYPGHRTQSALSPLPGEHSSQSPFYRRTHANPTTIPFASYRVPIYTPGSRAAMWIKCLAEGQKYQATVGIKLRTLSVRVERSHHNTMAPPSSLVIQKIWRESPFQLS